MFYAVKTDVGVTKTREEAGSEKNDGQRFKKTKTEIRKSPDSNGKSHKENREGEIIKYLPWYDQIDCGSL
jgi:hypothetical protein